MFVHAYDHGLCCLAKSSDLFSMPDLIHNMVLKSGNKMLQRSFADIAEMSSKVHVIRDDHAQSVHQTSPKRSPLERIGATISLR